MPKLTAETQEQRRQHIADAALRCFVRAGYANTSMADVIAESGLSAGSIYSHFDSKTELFRYASSLVLQKYQERLTNFTFARPAPTPADILTEVMTDDFPLRHAKVLIQVWVETATDPELQEITETNTASLRRFFQMVLMPWAESKGAESAATRAENAADLLFAVHQGIVARIAIDRDVNQADLVNRLAAALNAL